MTQNPDSLTADELASLREIAKGPRLGEIPSDHKQKLAKRGLITQRGVEYFLTEAGKKQLLQRPP